jgi:hypothetical protein
MVTLRGAGISVTLPGGWEGHIDTGGTQDDGAERRAVVHFGNFPLPAKRGDYGSGAVDEMKPGDVLVVMLEFGPEAVGTPLFSGQGMPRRLAASNFGRETVHRPLPGHGGMQRFYVEKGRAFCLYVVVASHLDRADLIPDLNRVLETVEIG